MRKSGETDSFQLDTLLEEKLRGTLPGVGGGGAGGDSLM